MTRIISVTSGQRGAGKTCIGLNLAARLAQRGKRVCLLDADPGSAGAVQVLRLDPPATLEDALHTGLSADEVLIRTAAGFDLLPGGSRADWLSRLTTEQMQQLAGCLQQLGGYDFLLIDSSSAITRNSLSLLLAGPEILLLITPQPASHNDAYALLKRLYAEQYDGRVHLVVNRALDEPEGSRSYTRFREVVDFHLDMQLPLLGLVNEDRQALQAGGGKEAPLHVCGDSGAALADRLLLAGDAVSERDVQSFGALCLQAAGVPVPGADRVLAAPGATSTGDQNLQRQIECLSAEVDALIAEIERLRSDAARAAPGPDRAPNRRDTQPDLCSQAGLAELASDTQDISIRGHRFSLYQLKQSNGRVQCFACQSLDDEIEAPESRTTSS